MTETFMRAPVNDRRTAADDAELLALMRRGEAGGFALLMRRNNRRLYRLARSIVKNDAEAEEIVQESYLRALTHLDSFKGEASLGTWLARIVANEALGRLRRRRPMVALGDVEETLAAGEGLGHGDQPSPEHAAARREIRGLIERAVDALPPHFRVVFMLRAVEQMSIEETAATLAIPKETVKTRLHRANRLLREALSTELGAILDDAFPFAGARCDRMMARVLEKLGFAAAAQAIVLSGDATPRQLA